MRGIVIRFAGVMIAGTALIGAAAAQIQQLPATSRAEANTNSINNSLSSQQQNRAAQQQNQFEVNSLRNDSARAAVAPPPVVVAPPIAGPAR